MKLSGNITVVHRSDGSGTTENFTKFLVKSAPDWKLKSGSTVEWPTDSQAGNGNTGVAQIIKDTKGAIGYVDLSDANATGLKYASILNKAGKYVKADIAGAEAAVGGVAINPDLTFDPIWADGDAAYPITSPTWIIVYAKQRDQSKADTVKAFIKFIETDEQKVAPTIDYAPIPKSLATQATAQLAKIVVG